MRLRREAPDPLYLQLKDSLVAEIASGRYRSNQRLPSERELVARFKVSRMTVRQALLELAHDGTIYTRVGKGTFVAEPKIDQQLRALTGVQPGRARARRQAHEPRPRSQSDPGYTGRCRCTAGSSEC